MVPSHGTRHSRVPELVVSVEDVPRFGGPPKKTSRHHQAQWHFEAVQLELTVGGHRADVFGIRPGGLPSVVDFRVTSPASHEKRGADIPAIEVDLRPLLGKSLTL